MSDKKPDAKQHSVEVDESFIHSLYQHLPSPQGNETLDNKILAAAHKAVHAKPQDVTLPEQAKKPDPAMSDSDQHAVDNLFNKARQDRDSKQKKSSQRYPQKRPFWLKPAAAAAMLVLVVGVSYQQIFDPHAPMHADAYLIHSERAIDQPTAKVSTENSSHDEIAYHPPVLNKAKAPPKMTGTASNAGEHSQSRQGYNNEPARVVSSEAITKQTIVPQPKPKPQKGIESVFYKPNTDGDILSADEEIFQDNGSVTLPPVLSKDAFLQSYQQTQWHYLQQDHNDYWLYPNDNFQAMFRASKKTFTLKNNDRALTSGDKVHLRLKTINE